MMTLLNHKILRYFAKIEGKREYAVNGVWTRQKVCITDIACEPWWTCLKCKAWFKSLNEYKCIIQYNKWMFFGCYFSFSFNMNVRRYNYQYIISVSVVKANVWLLAHLTFFVWSFKTTYLLTVMCFMLRAELLMNSMHTLYVEDLSIYVHYSSRVTVCFYWNGLTVMLM